MIYFISIIYDHSPSTGLLVSALHISHSFHPTHLPSFYPFTSPQIQFLQLFVHLSVIFIAMYIHDPLIEILVPSLSPLCRIFTIVIPTHIFYFLYLLLIPSSGFHIHLSALIASWLSMSMFHTHTSSLTKHIYQRFFYLKMTFICPNEQNRKFICLLFYLLFFSFNIYLP